jgi:transposase-like protein
MNMHKNARLTPRGRERIVRQVESGQTPEAVAEAAGVCPRTVRKWVDRYRREGWRDCRIAHPGRIGCTPFSVDQV